MTEPKKRRVVRQTPVAPLVLRNINPTDVEKKYKLVSLNTSSSLSSRQPSHTTSISNIVAPQSRLVSFIDESKHPREGTVSMIDFDTKEQLYNIEKSMNDSGVQKHCYWDRNVFTNQGIGCPIKYVPSKATFTYTSQTSQENHLLKSDINTNRLLDVDNKGIEIEKNDYYITDGIFCSFNCCQAFIDDKKNEPMYASSKFLILNIYNKIFDGNSIRSISPAPHWRLLKEYGGHLTIEKYRDSFNAKSYTNHGTIQTGHCISVLAVGTLFEENICINNELSCL